ncbi:MAG: hypothetical protein LUO89_06115 [Methanothrix sp.]|nr:hypothetical protein [Methanothrix sp.]
MFLGTTENVPDSTTIWKDRCPCNPERAQGQEAADPAGRFRCIART